MGTSQGPDAERGARRHQTPAAGALSRRHDRDERDHCGGQQRSGEERHQDGEAGTDSDRPAEACPSGRHPEPRMETAGEPGQARQEDQLCQPPLGEGPHRHR